jgi:DNA replication regulator DPB11
MVDEDISTAALRNVERPWKEVVITFTGVEQKVRSRLGTELMVESTRSTGAGTGRYGGECLDCTRHACRGCRVRVGQVSCQLRIRVRKGVAERQYAVEHRLPVLLPAWIEENHERWLGGHQVDTSVGLHPRSGPFQS